MKLSMAKLAALMAAFLGAAQTHAADALADVDDPFVIQVNDDTPSEGIVIENLDGELPLSDEATGDESLLDVCCCEPCWTFRVGSVFLDRDRPRDAVIAATTNGGVPVLQASEFGFDFEGGLDLYARRELGCGRSVEFRYFGVDEWTASNTTATAGLLVVGGVNVGGASGLDSSYDSALHSAELNLGCAQGCGWRLLAGMRYIDFDDSLAVGFAAGGPPLLTYRVETENKLYGLQLGVENDLYACGCWSLDSYVKAGLYYNDINRATGFFPNVGATLFPSDTSSDYASFLGDVGLNASYQVTDRVALRGGYQLMWLEGVAEASNQGAAFGGEPISRGGSPFFHGATFAVEAKW